jgi:hypothetical protein
MNLQTQTKDSSTEAKKIVVLKLFSRIAHQKEKIFKVDKDRVVLGGIDSADVKLGGEGIAPIHAVLELSVHPVSGRQLCTIFDLASETGVFVNGKKVITQILNDQDQLMIGRHQFEFSMQAPGSALRGSTRMADGRTLYLNPNEDLTPLLLEDEREVVEIFDYRPTAHQALEVVMSWCGVILAVEHFVTQKTVTVGVTKKSHFPIPPILGSAHFPIVSKKGDRFVLNLDPQMQGVLQKSGELKQLEELRGQSVQGPNGHEVALGPKDFAKVSIGEVDFYLSFTSAPPQLKMRRIFDRDPFFQKIFISSMLITGFIVYGVSTMKVPQNIEPDPVPQRIANILYEPEKFLNPPPVPRPTPKPRLVPKKIPVPIPPVIRPQPQLQPKPKPVVPVQLTPPPTPAKKQPSQPVPVAVQKQAVVPQVVSKPIPRPELKISPKTEAKPKVKSDPKPEPKPEAKEGEGARAKGAEGSRGERSVKKQSPTRSTELSRPSPRAGNKGASGASQVVDEGNVDLLKGAGGRIQNILGNSAAHLGDGSHDLKGFGNFSTHGEGGLALSGGGLGGGGDAETTLGGLGKKGSGMGRVGTGKGAAGSGSGIVGAQVRVAIRNDGPQEAVVMGAIDRNAVAEAIFAHKDEFRLCYEREINAEHPTLSGQIGTSFVIGASGRVTQAGIESSSLKSPNAERCVIAVLKRIEFPMPRGGGVVEVHFPFKFSAAGR